jgi:hypothetical protein
MPTGGTTLADDLIKTPLGREAAKGGWMLGLHDFARREGRAPQDREVDQIKREAKEFDAGLREGQCAAAGRRRANLEALGHGRCWLGVSYSVAACSGRAA